MQEWVMQFGTSHEYLVYLAIAVLACVEGPILSVLFGVLIHAGYFGFVPVYAALILGDLAGDSVWYWAGRRYGAGLMRKFGGHLGITEARVEKARALFHRHSDWILILSKVTNGFGLSLVTLITAGMARIHFGRYLALNLAGQFVWSGLLIAVGYFFGAFFVLIDTVLGRVGSIGLVAVAGVIAFVTYRALAEKVSQRI
jgi:membrane protein DedA with SNARE-associated domain